MKVIQSESPPSFFQGSSAMALKTFPFEVWWIKTVSRCLHIHTSSLEVIALFLHVQDRPGISHPLVGFGWLCPMSDVCTFQFAPRSLVFDKNSFLISWPDSPGSTEQGCSATERLISVELKTNTTK
jgi:hypothetical protein